jgi:hypothetical protein
MNILKKKMKTFNKKSQEKSFTLIETLIALGLMVTMVLQIASVMGTSISLSSYDAKMVRAMWLAKSLASQIEHDWLYYELKEFRSEMKGEKFDDFLCAKEEPCPFKYNLSFKKWDIPIFDIIMGGVGKSSSQEDNPLAAMVKEQVEKQLDGELVRVANIEVTWAEGSRENMVELPYLITNQKTLDEKIELLGPIPASALTKQ